RIDVVIEAILDRWTKRELDIGKEPHHRTGHHVSAAVAQHIESLGIPVGQNLKAMFTFVRQFAIEIDDFAIHLGRDSCLREPLADAFSNLTRGGPGGGFLEGAIGEFESNHECSFHNPEAQGRGTPSPWETNVSIWDRPEATRVRPMPSHSPRAVIHTA